MIHRLLPSGGAVRPSMVAASLSTTSGRPVRLAYDRHEDIIGTTKRHPAVVRHRTAVARDGTLAPLAEVDAGTEPVAAALVTRVD